MDGKYEISINLDDKKLLLGIARETIFNHVSGIASRNYNEIELSPGVIQRAGAFVSLHKSGKLRGCIGKFISDEALYRLVQQMSLSCAFRDHRFDPVGIDELSDIEIEISVLSPFKRIDSIKDFMPGKHGIYIKKGEKSGTFLPQVGSKTKWSKEQLLGYCSRDKAGIGWDGWKDAELFIYTALVFSEKDI